MCVNVSIYSDLMLSMKLTLTRRNGILSFRILLFILKLTLHYLEHVNLIIYVTRAYFKINLNGRLPVNISRNVAHVAYKHQICII